ncbi:NAD(P)H-hydrate dehydratase [Rubellicoccus peritrichatus]|uniref:ADP-dependent (S)-NAD(P)H-hydrate dehydratase n=1 Tax=Rubellicoccus peritrichatus TaxID=3080537 RepID=A0AAQ3QVG5_9BACT|nr:NAD(P)H-hydrate dehydratase [Puniceicoccus sp. CR14]WOO41583.1 NAD(P)H-hydrate dehydratase [Puniceicoccus sp. CR14]
MPDYAHPILTCEEAQAFEKELLHGDGAEWTAMNRAGRSVGRSVLADYRELGHLPPHCSILVLIGKGHNGGDALLAADEICRANPDAEVAVLPMQPVEQCRTLTRRAFDGLQRKAKVQLINLARAQNGRFDICLDGLLGMNFRPPVREPARKIIDAVNDNPGIRFRAAVDIPSGLGDSAFRADFTYATGIAKTPIFHDEHTQHVGRIRYLDIGFFDSSYDGPQSFNEAIMTSKMLGSLSKLRPANSDKRTFGHLFVLSGSRSMPGALLMGVKAALRSGVGLLTAFAPESVAAQFAAIVPEVMWVPWPETPDGGLALEGRHLLLERLDRADALLAGSGVGKEPETLELIRECVSSLPLPVVLDADTLTPQIAAAAAGRPSDAGSVITTPHHGEFKRMAKQDSTVYDSEALRQFCLEHNIVTALKGPITRVSNGKQIINATFGGPVLARGGSGDILAGMVGSLLAQSPTDAFEATCRAVCWHGLAANRLAQQQGAQAVTTTDLLEHLAPVLRGE